MKTMKKILSVVSAGIMAMTCTSPAFADAPYDDGIIMYGDSGHGINILYEDSDLIIIENQNGKSGDCIIKKYDFSMNYTISKSDKKITPSLFNLPDNTVLSKTESTASTETYSVKVETAEELDELYNSAKKLTENDVIINGYKQFTYDYGCFYGCFVTLALNEEDENFDPNSIEGLENINFTRNDVIVEEDGKQLQSYFGELGLNDFITVKKLQDTILAEDNIAVFDTSGYCVCAAWHSPNTIRIFVDEYSVNASEAVVGDANGDMSLNARDCSFIARTIAEGKTGEISKNADFNEDGKVNVRDASAIAKHLISLYRNPIDNPTV